MTDSKLLDKLLKRKDIYKHESKLGKMTDLVITTSDYYYSFKIYENTVYDEKIREVRLISKRMIKDHRVAS